MADIVVTAASVGDASPHWSIKLPFIASAAITAGTPVYIVTTTGKVAAADASAANTSQVIGIAEKTAAAGQAVSVIVMGLVEGFTLTSLSYWDAVQLSDTAGTLDSGGAPTKTCIVGRVVGATDNDASKLLFVNCLYRLILAVA